MWRAIVRTFSLAGLLVALPLSIVYAQSPRSEQIDSPDVETSPPSATRSAEARAKPAREADEPRPATEGIIENAAITEHKVHIGGEPLSYTATAAHMLMRDEEGKTKARVFFVAYEAQRDRDADPAGRPITFVFNGGPGAAAVWLHLGTAGPRRIDLTPEGEVPPPPYRLVENTYSWLDATDLVFIDPVGTGFSRPAKGEKGEQFYGVREDIASIADFIRLYISHYERWLSPLFLAGESYGTTRAAGLSEYLLDRHGIALNGIMLISSVLDFATLSPGDGNDLPYALYLPSYTAIAWYHKRLDPELLSARLEDTLAEVEEWATGDYLVALARGSALAPEARAKVVERLARYTGLPPELIERADLRIDPGLFQKRLLAREEQLIGRFDSRIVGYDPRPPASRPEYDPSLARYLPVYSATFNDYVRRVLHFESTLPYEVLSDRVHPWKYNEDGQGYLFVADNLRSAMIKNPHLKVLFASGYFDLATPYFATTYTIDHMNLSRGLRSNIRETFYRGGHMMYHHQPSLAKLHDDVTAFIRASTP